jgi:hypothetical protein
LRDYLKPDESEFGMTQSAQRRIVIDNNTTSTKQNFEIALRGGRWIFSSNAPFVAAEAILAKSIDDRTRRNTLTC